MVAGGKIGVTPFNAKLPRVTKVVPLLVRMPGYGDFTSKIDLSDGYTNEAIELIKLPEPPPVAPAGLGSAGASAITAPPPTPATTPTASVTSPESTSNEPDRTHVITHVRPSTSRNESHASSTTKTPSSHSSPPAIPPKPKCQPPGAVNPYDTSCNGEACPPCQ